MANQKHLKILKEGVETWNQWRKEHPRISPDLRSANLNGADLEGADLTRADLAEARLIIADLREAILVEANLTNAKLEQARLRGAKLRKAVLNGANFSTADLVEADLRGLNPLKYYMSDSSIVAGMYWELSIKASLNNIDQVSTTFTGANLSSADLRDADLAGVNFTNANLTSAILRAANLTSANFNSANLSSADLSHSLLIRTDFTKAILTGCRIYGIAAWDVRLHGTSQLDLSITPSNQPTITVDNIEVAQFIYLLLNNDKIRDVIDTITSKVVLILGRFTPERKRVLDVLREELRKKDFLPIVFDFDVPTNRNVTETITTLARLSRFIIADITDPKSIPQELAFIIPDLPSVPVQPLLHARSKEYGMYDHFKSFPWVLPVHHYTTVDRLLASLKEQVIEPAENKAKELAIERAERLKRP